jgi:hypothetical protein
MNVVLLALFPPLLRGSEWQFQLFGEWFFLRTDWL